MRGSNKAQIVDRRRFLTGAAGAASAFVIPGQASRAQTVQPTATPVPIRIQTPDLAFASALQAIRDAWAAANGVDDLVLSIVPAEPASDQLLTDARSGARRFSGALVPSWLVPDLVRDDFILPASAPATPIPDSIARLRSFGGEWYATDLDRDCDLLFYRQDLLDRQGMTPADRWDSLLEQATELAEQSAGGIGVPLTHAQQVVDHFVSMAASFVATSGDLERFWFDPDSMSPSLASANHRQALEIWKQLGWTMPVNVRNGTTGDLWQALIAGSIVYLIASADFLPFALDQGIDPSVLGVSQLPGVISTDGNVLRAGNVTGTCWGAVTMSSTGDATRSEVTALLDLFAGSDAQESLWTDQNSGVLPAPGSVEDAQRIGAALETAGWSSEITQQWVDALSATFGNAVQLPALRIAETQRYLHALEDRIVPFLTSDTGSAMEALEGATSDWNDINMAIGVETQRDLYGRSLMPPPVAN